jgi:hypothetical protein
MPTNPEETRRIAEMIRNYSEEELTSFRANAKENSFEVILAEREFERRAREAQHTLDLRLIGEQVRWMKFAAMLTAAATLIGAIVGGTAGAILTWWLQRNPPQARLQPSAPAQESEPSSSVDRKGKAESVPSKPPKSN